MSRLDPWQEPEALDFIHAVLEDMKPKLTSSAIVASLLPDTEGDVKFWVELGASIMMDKPIMVIATDDRKVPPKLALVADRIVRVEGDLNTQVNADRIASAIAQMIEDRNLDD